MIETTLTLRAVSGYFEPKIQTAYANTDLHIKLQDNGQLKGQAVLFFNGAAFIMKNNEYIIPASKIKEVNNCILQDKDEAGNVINEWLIETLCFDLAKLDKQCEKQMLAERALMQGLKESFAQLAQRFTETKIIQKRLAEEIIKQGQIIAEMQKDIEALKNEQQI